MSIVKPAQPGNAFDVNRPLSTAEALAFRNAAYLTAIRYIPRTASLTEGNLTGVEIESILAAGLDLMAVQHVALDGWHPTETLGAEYGEYAASYAKQIGLPIGMSIWLDLEGVSVSTLPEDADRYCRAWYAAVKAAGYLPGIYVGFGTGLSDQQLHLLPFTNYWRSYNCDQRIPVRGYQIHQYTQKTFEGITFDPNAIAADALGDLPFVLAAS